MSHHALYKKHGFTALILFVVFTSGVLAIARTTRGHDWGGDFAAYIMQAKSVIEATPQTYLEANRFTIEQSSNRMGPIAYPWGYPLLLVPIYSLYGLNPLALKSIGLISHLLFLLLLWGTLRKEHSTPFVVFLICLFAFNPTFLEFVDQIMSDLPFLLISTLCMFLTRDIIVRRRCIISRFWDLFLLGAGVAFACQIRSNGVLLLVALVVTHVASAFHRHHSDVQINGTCQARMVKPNISRGAAKKISMALPLVPYATFLCFTSTFNVLLPEGGASHLSHFHDVSMFTVKSNLYKYLELPSEFFRGAPLPLLMFGATIPLAVAGAIHRFRSEYNSAIYMVLTLLTYIVWPAYPVVRFLFPIFPFYFSFAISGLEIFANGGTTIRQRRIRYIIAFAPVILVLRYFLLNDVKAARWDFKPNSEITYGPFASTSKELFSFVANHTEPDSVIIFFKPRVMKLMTDRQSIRMTRADLLFRGDYLCLYQGPGASFQVAPVIIAQLEAHGTAKIVFENKDFKVYRLINNEYPQPSDNNKLSYLGGGRKHLLTCPNALAASL